MNIYINCILLGSFLFSLGWEDIQPFESTSVSTSSGLSTLHLNPAGLGLNNGSVFGFGFYNLYSSNSMINISSINDGLGTFILIDKDLNYKYSIGYGFGSSNRKISSGVQWFSKTDSLSFGLLLRPLNSFSLGLVADYGFRNQNFYSLIGSVAYRPFGHRFTIGADYTHSIIDSEGKKASLFFETQILDGLRVNFKGSSLGGDDLGNSKWEWLVSLGLDLNNSGYFFNHSNSDANLAFMYYDVPHPSIFKKTKKSHYVKLKLEGNFIEEPVSDKSSFNISFESSLVGFSSPKNIQLRKFIETIDNLTNDESINGMVVELSGVSGGLAKLKAVHDALQRFKASGKKIIVYATYISNTNYYLISMADEIYMPDLSSVDLRGLLLQVTFFKELFDSLNIVAEVEQITPYKAALDPYLYNSMTDEFRENISMLGEDLYESFVNDLALARGYTSKKMKEIIDNGPYSSSAAKKVNLISGMMYPDQFKNYIKKLEKEISFTSFENYIEQESYYTDWIDNSQNKIAVIYAVGSIMLGESQRGQGASTIMGNKTIVKAIRAAREDKSIKAIILRIDSGGGSALSSDLMWREIWKTTISDSSNIKPFIASMSDVAASGGYYIACQADTIVADKHTVTGSIGVISGRINFSNMLNRFGIHNDQVKFGNRSDFWSGSKLWSEEERQVIRDEIVAIYGTFLNRVAMGRENLDSLDVNEVALGKVWSGARAKELGLVDEVGGLLEAIQIAKSASGIKPEENVTIIEYPKQKSISFLFNDDKDINFRIDHDLDGVYNLINELPDFENDRMQLVSPYKLDIK